MCTSRPPRAKYASIAGLGYKGSCGYDLYSLADWGDRVSVITEFWEEGKPGEHPFNFVSWVSGQVTADGRMYYYSLDERAELKKQFRAAKRGEKLIFSGWEKKAFSWDHCGVLAMVRKVGPVSVCWFRKEYRDQVLAEEHAKLQAQLAALPASLRVNARRLDNGQT